MRHVSAGQGGWAAGDSRGLSRTTGDGVSDVS